MAPGEFSIVPRELLVGTPLAPHWRGSRRNCPIWANARVMEFNYDTGERYLLVPDFLPELRRLLTPSQTFE